MDDLQRLAHARLAHRAQAVQESAADVGALGAECHGLQHVLPRADATVHVHFNVIAHRGHDGRQRFDAALRAVELAPTVVANDQSVGPAGHGQFGVFHILNALQDELAAPAFLDPFHVAPIQARVELRRRPRGEIAHVGHALDMAHDVAELPPFRARHAKHPARLGGDVDDVGQGQLGRR